MNRGLDVRGPTDGAGRGRDESGRAYAAAESFEFCAGDISGPRGCGGEASGRGWLAATLRRAENSAGGCTPTRAPAPQPGTPNPHLHPGPRTPVQVCKNPHPMCAPAPLRPPMCAPAPPPRPPPTPQPAWAREPRAVPACAAAAALPRARSEPAASVLLRPRILITAALICMSRGSGGPRLLLPRWRIPRPRQEGLRDRGGRFCV